MLPWNWIQAAIFNSFNKDNCIWSQRLSNSHKEMMSWFHETWCESSKTFRTLQSLTVSASLFTCAMGKTQLMRPVSTPQDQQHLNAPWHSVQLGLYLSGCWTWRHHAVWTLHKEWDVHGPACGPLIGCGGGRSHGDITNSEVGGLVQSSQSCTGRYETLATPTTGWSFF